MPLTSRLAAVFVALSTCVVSVHGGTTPVGTSFTYQGSLKLSETPVEGAVDFEFRLFEDPAGGLPINGTVVSQTLIVANGLFAAELDFGASVFAGDERWLDISVRFPSGSGVFTALAPRQRISGSPYALFALNANIVGTQSGAVNFTNTANTYLGNGAGLTQLNADSITAGTLPGFALNGNYSGAITFSNATNSYLGAFTGSGSGLTGLNASNITSGILPISLGGTGATSASTALSNLGGAPLSHTHVLSSLTGTLLPAQLPTGGSWALASNLAIDTTTFAVDQLNNRVGVGLTTPLADLHIRGAGTLGSLLITPTTADTLSQIALAENSTNTFGMIMRMDGGANQLHFLANNSGIEQPPVMSIARSSAPLVGIGTTNPQGALHVQEGSAGTILPAGNASLVLERSNSNYIHMYGPDANETGVLFGGDTTDLRGGVVFNAASTSDGMQFRTGGNTTRAVIDSTGNLGVGTTAPAEKLHVVGNARIDGDIIIPLTTRYLAFGPFAFSSGTDNTDYIRNGAQLIGGTAGSIVNFGAPIELPDGAVITGVLLSCKDNAAADVTLNLQRIAIDTGVLTGGITVSSSGASVAVRTFTGATGWTVDNEQFTYSLGLSWTTPPTTSDIIIVGARITYTITEPLP